MPRLTPSMATRAVLFSTTAWASGLTVADSATWAQPTISGNRVFVKDVTSLALWTF